ncbi:DUF2613 domain-containing protein [Rhodococcus sp. NPDC049939]|uniref:DUF2613 domain-containing protein n=1 Tax=Rhodococcus sp. NPDC049939 TaxID=3155511 RepID=UPI0033C4C84E
MGKFLVPGAVSAVVGLALGTVATLGITAAAQQNTRPVVEPGGNPSSSLLNQVEYGSR